MNFTKALYLAIFLLSIQPISLFASTDCSKLTTKDKCDHASYYCSWYKSKCVSNCISKKHAEATAKKICDDALITSSPQVVYDTYWCLGNSNSPGSCYWYICGAPKADRKLKAEVGKEGRVMWGCVPRFED